MTIRTWVSNMKERATVRCEAEKERSLLMQAEIERCRNAILTTSRTRQVICSNCGWTGPFGQSKLKGTLMAGTLEEVWVPIYRLDEARVDNVIPHWTCGLHCPKCGRRMAVNVARILDPEKAK